MKIHALNYFTSVLNVFSSHVNDGQMPYLDEWSALEEEYSTSLSATTHALSNSLVRLPVGGNVQVTWVHRIHNFMNLSYIFCT